MLQGLLQNERSKLTLFLPALSLPSLPSHTRLMLHPMRERGPLHRRSFADWAYSAPTRLNDGHKWMTAFAGSLMWLVLPLYFAASSTERTTRRGGGSEPVEPEPEIERFSSGTVYGPGLVAPTWLKPPEAVDGPGFSGGSAPRAPSFSPHRRDAPPVAGYPPSAVVPEGRRLQLFFLNSHRLGIEQVMECINIAETGTNI